MKVKILGQSVKDNGGGTLGFLRSLNNLDWKLVVRYMSLSPLIPFFVLYPPVTKTSSS